MAGSAQFPKGLRVLLVDDHHSCVSIRPQLEAPGLQYCVTSVHSAAEALSFLRTGVAAFDVVLAEATLVAGDEAIGRSFIDSFEETPVVLMAAGAPHEAVMRAVRLGAVDFLDKPLSHLKLKNIWQHSVRRMMLKAAGPRAAGCAAAAIPGAAPAVPPTVAALANTWSASLAASMSAASLAPESPGTPSMASGADGPLDSFSGGCSEAGSARSSIDARDGGQDSFMEALTAALAPPPLANGAPAPAVWPALPSGCVWGTPAGGPVLPPLPAPPAPPVPAAWPATPTPPTPAPEPAPAPLKPPPPPVAPVAATTDELIMPEGFLSEAMQGSSASGPLGLRLRKSASLLNMINAALGSSDSLNGLAAMVC